jgi:hypothetical protein
MKFLRQQFAVAIDLTIPAGTITEFFYTTTADPGFTPEHVVSVPMKRWKKCGDVRDKRSGV